MARANQMRVIESAAIPGWSVCSHARRWFGFVITSPAANMRVGGGLHVRKRTIGGCGSHY